MVHPVKHKEVEFFAWEKLDYVDAIARIWNLALLCLIHTIHKLIFP